ncbi:MAG: leucyl/phenylalanyl-tRNA--protein transferase [Xanthomonadales bacterium]|nr:leucyl/phenylalanyl-tRNA--protein transferase [Xanthomonadales bacterium]
MPLHQLHPDYPELFPETRLALRDPPGLLAVGGDLQPQRLLAAYRCGVFPWFGEDEPVLWWSPPVRCVLHAERFHKARRFERWLRGCSWRVGVDEDFAGVVAGCAAPRADHAGTWIGPQMRTAYQALYRAGFAHSIEVRDGDELIGGLYGVNLGGVFYAESMYSRRPQASKVALLALCRQWQDWGNQLIDVQMETAHLLSLGAHCLTRRAFEIELERALQRAAPALPWASHWHRSAAAELLRPDL